MNDDKPNRRLSGSHLRSALDVVATVSIIALSLTLVWTLLSGRAVAGRSDGRSPNAGAPGQRPEPPLPTEPISLDGARTQGSASARAVVIEYSDFQCPYCGVFARSTLITLEQEYVASGRVLLAFRNLPIEKLHPLAFKAAEAAECAGRQDRFWQMHDLLFRNQEALDQPSLVADAKALQLDTARFLGCLSGQVTDQVRKDRDSAQALLITGTPTFLLGVKQSDGRVKVMRRLSGAQPIDQFKTALGVVLSETR